MALLDGNLCLSLSAGRLDAQGKTSEDGYPPYNVELVHENEAGQEGFRITLAVAGFGRNELEVSIENGTLAIRGAKREEGQKDYLHYGIAARRFERTFALAQGVKVSKAELHDGLLAIELERPHREITRPQGWDCSGRVSRAYR